MCPNYDPFPSKSTDLEFATENNILCSFIIYIQQNILNEQ